MINSDAIITVIDKITRKNKAPCKKTLQKIIFLIEEKNLDLGCDYGIHFYGPYSADLDFAIRELSDEGRLNIQYTHKEHIISVQDNVEYNEFKSDVIDEVINKFGNDTPGKLELIATALYVYRGVNNVDKITDGVKKIKGEKYDRAEIKDAIFKLQETNYIPFK